jgi:hypothetical protein
MLVLLGLGLLAIAGLFVWCVRGAVMQHGVGGVKTKGYYTYTVYK